MFNTGQYIDQQKGRSPVLSGFLYLSSLRELEKLELNCNASFFHKPENTNFSSQARNCKFFFSKKCLLLVSSEAKEYAKINCEIFEGYPLKTFFLLQNYPFQGGSMPERIRPLRM